jgi:hypothetical protein
VLESLEDRVLLAPFVVKQAGDSGPGTLRQAILDANATAELDTITFAIGPGTQTIHPTAALPIIEHPVIIDGTPPGEFPDQIIEINGALTPFSDGLVIEGGSSTVRGLDNGVHLSSAMVFKPARLARSGQSFHVRFSATMTTPRIRNPGPGAISAATARRPAREEHPARPVIAVWTNVLRVRGAVAGIGLTRSSSSRERHRLAPDEQRSPGIVTPTLGR